MSNTDWVAIKKEIAGLALPINGIPIETSYLLTKPAPATVKIKKLVPEAVVPSYAKSGDAGMDLTCTSVGHSPYGQLVCSTGIAMEIPVGYVGLIYPRSSIFKTGLVLSNHVGVIDSGYRGEIKFIFNRSSNSLDYKLGDRIGQIIIMPYPTITFQEVTELNESVRGDGGFGSSGV